MLMKNNDVELDQKLIDKYNELDLKSRMMITENEGWSNELLLAYKHVRDELLKLNNDLYYVVDVLVKYLYTTERKDYKVTLWESFGDVIVENLNINLKNKFGQKSIQCSMCGKRIRYYNTKKYCEKCAKEKERIRKRLRKRKWRLHHKSGSENEKSCNP